MKRRGFTLVELLVVISIIALLISLLLPALARARIVALQAVCASNIRGLVQGCIEYAQTHQNQYPMDYQMDWPMGGLGTPPGYVAPNSLAWGLSDLYTDGILTDPNFIYCPDSAPELTPQSTLGQMSGPNLAAGVYLLPKELQYYESKDSTFAANWPQKMLNNGAWFNIVSSYCYWYKRPNGQYTAPSTTNPYFDTPSANQYGVWINPATKIGKRHNYADPTDGLYCQSPTDSSNSILITDLVTSANGSWNVTFFTSGIYCNHMHDQAGPDGANIGYNDGSVSWKPLSQLSPGYRHFAVSSSVPDFYR